MARVKVWNDNTYPHVEKFKGTKITLEPGASIEMDYEEAIEFLGQFTPRVKRADGTDDPRFFKKLRMERPKTPVVAELPLVNHATGQTATSIQELAALLKATTAERANDPVAEAAAASGLEALKQQNAELLARLEALEAKASEVPIKRGPGRPRKAVNA